jgi:hypothetical protein
MVLTRLFVSMGARRLLRRAWNSGLCIPFVTLTLLLCAAGARADTYDITFFNVTFSATCIGGTGTCTEVINGSGLYDNVGDVASNLSITLSGSLNASLNSYGAPSCSGPLCLQHNVLYDTGTLPGYKPIEFSPTLPTFNAPIPEALVGGPNGTLLFVPGLCGGDQPSCGKTGTFPGGADYELTSGTYTSVDITPTPEPGGLVLLCTGLLGIIFACKRLFVGGALRLREGQLSNH